MAKSETNFDVIGSERLEFFSDAIMAIAATLLVTNIAVPAVSGVRLGHSLAHLWPSYLAFVLSFCTIGLVWVAHHSMFRRVSSVNRPLLMLNLLLLMFVVLLPFATAVLARFSWNGSQGSGAASEVYSLNMLLIGLSFQALWFYLGRHPDLMSRTSQDSIRGATWRAAVVPSAYAITSVVAPFNSVVCYAIWIATTIYISVGPSARRVGS
jgi:uncharacterized membrane protein